jgi:tetratricopeptide (TPR) repeat protein
VAGEVGIVLPGSQEAVIPGRTRDVLGEGSNTGRQPMSRKMGWWLAIPVAGAMAVSAAVIANLPGFDRPSVEADGSPLKWALTVREHAAGGERGDLGLLPEDLARFYLGQGRYAEAEAIYRQAIAIYEEDPEAKRAPCCVEAADCCRSHGQGAGVSCQQCSAIHRHAAGTDSTAFVKTLEGYATLLSEMGRAAEAGKFKLRAKAVREQQGRLAQGPGRQMSGVR